MVPDSVYYRSRGSFGSLFEGAFEVPREIRILTPENIEIKYYLAGLPSRIAAFFHDVLLQVVIVFCFALLLGFMEGFLGHSIRFFRPYMDVLVTLSSFALFWFYHIFFEIFWEGQTPGKYKYGVRVVTVDGQRIGFYASFLRNILRVVDFLPFLFLSGSLSIVVSRKCQRLGDLLSQTIVIREIDEFPNPLGGDSLIHWLADKNSFRV